MHAKEAEMHADATASEALSALFYVLLNILILQAAGYRLKSSGALTPEAQGGIGLFVGQRAQPHHPHSPCCKVYLDSSIAIIQNLLRCGHAQLLSLLSSSTASPRWIYGLSSRKSLAPS
jgi:hypothetical protein